MFTIQLSAKNIIFAEDVKSLVNDKLKKLEKYTAKFPQDSLKAIVMIKKRKHRSDDDIFTTAIAFYIPSRIFHAHQEGYSLIESITGAVEDIEDQLGRYKGRLEERG